MGHMIAFGLLAIVAGLTQIIGMTRGGPDSEFGRGFVVAGICALVWAGAVLLVRLIP
jgi:hypothetical protein